jgi:hypothetical protein
MKKNTKYKWNQQLSILQWGCCPGIPEEFNHLHCNRISFKISNDIVSSDFWISWSNVLFKLCTGQLELSFGSSFWTVMSVIAANRSDGKSFVKSGSNAWHCSLFKSRLLSSYMKDFNYYFFKFIVFSNVF